MSARKSPAPAESGRESPPSGDEKETGRLEAFSDGVFAIAITLLVLDLKVPKPSELPAGPGPLGAHGLLAALIAQWPTLLAYLTSFLSILVMWVNHHLLFSLIRRTDHFFLYLNGLLLLFVTFVPFPTALVAAYLQRREATAAAALYSASYFAIAIVFNLLWRHAARGRRLLDRAASDAAIAEIDRSYRFGPPLYALAFVLAFVNLAASLVTCLALAIFFSVTGSRSRQPK
ncbi:MAG TPA: TMEM175 family protein [Thermoanaerobaculia bacterium]|nr:TMEM175 family protein [Thermoanaerobaculia bacterium]